MAPDHEVRTEADVAAQRLLGASHTELVQTYHGLCTGVPETTMEELLPW